MFALKKQHKHSPQKFNLKQNIHFHIIIWLYAKYQHRCKTWPPLSWHTALWTYQHPSTSSEKIILYTANYVE